MACSLDFFIAKTDGSVSWMETSDSYEKGVAAVTAEGLGGGSEVEAHPCRHCQHVAFENDLATPWRG